MTAARLAAARLLIDIERGRATLGAELERARAGLDDRRDRGLLVELAAGTLRWRGELDALIAHAGRRPVSRLEVAARTVLRLGAYQLRHLERVPAHAIVNESVETIRALGAPRAAGLVNAVLRSIARADPAQTVLPPRPVDLLDRDGAIRYLSTTLSHPEWLVARWLERYPFDLVERWCLFNNTAPDVTVRTLAPPPGVDLGELLGREHIEVHPAPFMPHAWRLPPGQLGRIPQPLRETLFVQDEGAQLVAKFAGAQSGEHVLDVCAAPGGKTVVLSRDLDLPGNGKSLLVAGDLRMPRVAVLQKALTRAGIPPRVVAHDALRGLPFGPVFDCVVLDAPCSGLGTLRRDPDLKWSRTEAQVPELAARETQMLTIAAETVRPGGRLVYATCSSEPEENTGVVDAFLATNRTFALGTSPPHTAMDPVLMDGRGCLKTEPFRHGLDAFFAAVLVRHPAA